ncbi:MAG: site-specific DNA-methyltransferase [Planctomycetota bacterium]
MIDLRKLEHLGVTSSSEDGDIHNNDAFFFLENCPAHRYEAIITDPPYEIGIAGKDWDCKKLRIDVLAYQFHRVLKPSGNVFVFCSDFQFGDWYQELSRYFTKLRKFAWCKTDSVGFNKGMFQESFELGLHVCSEDSYFGTKKRKNYVVSGKTSGKERLMPDPDEKWSTKKGEKSLHPTQKSLEVIETLVTSLSKEGDTIFDPFSGTGTLGVAAKTLGRRFEMVEYGFRYHIAAWDRILGKG